NADFILTPSMNHFVLHWERPELTELGKSMGKLAAQTAVQYAATEGLKQTFLRGLMTAFAWPATIMYAAEASLRRLKTDVIDLYQYHRPDGVTPTEETLRALDDLVRQGKVRHIGNSNFTAVQAHESAEVSGTGDLASYVTAQNHYSLLTRDIEDELVPACEDLGLTVLPYFPLESGTLTGKYTRNVAPAEGTRMATFSAMSPALAARFLNEERFNKIEQLTSLADSSGAKLLDFAFGWLLSKSYIASVIAGATRPEQLEANVKAALWRPTPDVDREIDRITRPA
ncbi:MAG: DUF726 domain-containing protein, partial [Rhodospirillaceae bacterium]|nr:DUF726 domain-containing protein [Rhodospirillaceae bacterium]